MTFLKASRLSSFLDSPSSLLDPVDMVIDPSTTASSRCLSSKLIDGTELGSVVTVGQIDADGLSDG